MSAGIEAQRRAQRKYLTKCKTYILRFRQDNDADVVDKLARVPNVTGYIRGLVRRDLNGAE